MNKISIKLIIILQLITSVSFAQWTLQGTLTGLGSYPSISVFSPTGIVIAGGLVNPWSAKVYISTNSGNNWTDISGDLPPVRLFALWAVNENLIFVGAQSAPGGVVPKMWKTTNGGINWTLVLSSGGFGYFNDIIFSRTNPMIGIATCDPITSGGEHFLAKTTDGGNSWVVQTTIATGGAGITLSGVCIDNLFYGWGIVSNYGQKRVLLTTNGGANWNIIAVNLPGNDFTVSGLAFSSDKTTGIAASNTTLPLISRSSDGGTTWSTVNTGLPLTSTTIARMKWVYGTNWCYLSGDTGTSGSIGKSTNGGLNWSVMNTAGVNRINHFELVHNGGNVYAYAIAKDGRVIRLQETLTGIETVSNEVPAHFYLYQNYPNPFNPVTKINFSIAKTGFVRIVIYDALGRELGILVNEELNAGTYEADWDGSRFGSGVYFYKITTKGFSEVKKMILLK